MATKHETFYEPDVAVLLAHVSELFAKAFAVFATDFLKRMRAEGCLSQENDMKSDVPWKSWAGFPVELREKLEKEMQRNKQLLASGQLQAVEFTSSSAPEAIADRLREIMKEKGLSQSDLAKKMGTSDSVVSKWLKDPSRSKLSTLRRVAKSLDVDVTKLMGL
ncbi:MAG: helix-turn-helix transcriptional regulator [Phycisphaerales bacterium]